MTKAQKAEQQKAIETLREILPPGSTVHVYCTHVSRSGMSRNIVPLALCVGDDGQPYTRHIGYLVSKAIGERSDGDQGVKMGGCGMDMGFALVYALSHALHPDGFGCTGERCPSADHHNGDRDRTPHGHRGPKYDAEPCAKGDKSSLSHWHKGGGYSLSHRWI
jgi:hypothetical protein